MHNILRAPNPGLNKIIIIIHSRDRELGVYLLRISFVCVEVVSFRTSDLISLNILFKET